MKLSVLNHIRNTLENVLERMLVITSHTLTFFALSNTTERESSWTNTIAQVL